MIEPFNVLFDEDDLFVDANDVDLEKVYSKSIINSLLNHTLSYNELSDAVSGGWQIISEGPFVSMINNENTIAFNQEFLAELVANKKINKDNFIDEAYYQTLV